MNWFCEVFVSFCDSYLELLCNSYLVIMPDFIFSPPLLVNKSNIPVLQLLKSWYKINEDHSGHRNTFLLRLVMKNSFSVILPYVMAIRDTNYFFTVKAPFR